MTERHATNICAPSYRSQIPMKALNQAHYDLAIVFGCKQIRLFWYGVHAIKKVNIQLPKNTKWFYSLNNNNEKAYTTKNKCTVAKKETKLRAFKSVTKLIGYAIQKTEAKHEIIFAGIIRKSVDTQIHQ